VKDTINRHKPARPAAPARPQPAPEQWTPPGISGRHTTFAPAPQAGDNATYAAAAGLLPTPAQPGRPMFEVLRTDDELAAEAQAADIASRNAAADEAARQAAADHVAAAQASVDAGRHVYNERMEAARLHTLLQAACDCLPDVVSHDGELAGLARACDAALRALLKRIDQGVAREVTMT
jgi:hypothetical protein